MDRVDIITRTLVSALKSRADWFRDIDEEYRDFCLYEDGEEGGKVDLFGVDVSEINLRDVAREIDAALNEKATT